MIRRLFIVLVFNFLVIYLYGQVIYESGKPLGPPLAKLPVIEVPKLDIEKLLQEDKLQPKPFRVGQNFIYELDFKQNSYLLHTDSLNVWYLKIKAQNGTGLSVAFKKIALPKGAKLYLYSADGKFVVGPITYKNNKPKQILPTQYIPSLEVIIEYQEPLDVEPVDFVIDYVTVYYKNFLQSQPCEVNINCPEGAGYQVIKHSVAKIVFKVGLSQYLCSGALIANTANKGTPYFLTAAHCISSESSANSTTFYFNYEAYDCAGDSINPGQTVTYATLVATGDPDLDFTLLRLSVIPPSSYSPYYAGWSRVSDPASIDSTICIHHPAGDVKKISKDFDNPGVGSFTGYDPNTHWQIYAWDVGTTEGGSSGSPLFDPNKRIIGDLTGGEASCDYNYNDYFAQFYQSWDRYPDSTKQLKYWLDPLNISPVYLDGYDPYQYVDTTLTGVPAIYGYTDSNVAYIFWLSPYENPDSVLYENFEDYAEFRLSIPGYQAVDVDEGITWGIEGVSFPNENYKGAFIIINDDQMEPQEPKGWKAHSGNQYVAFFSNQINYPQNNDWLILPKTPIGQNYKLIFYAKSVSDKYPMERLRVLVAENASELRNFLPISAEPYIEVPYKWTKFVFDLSKYAGKSVYIAFNYVSDNSFALLLDDIAITHLPEEAFKETTDDQTSEFDRAPSPKNFTPPKLVNSQILSYTVFKNYKPIKTVPADQTYYSETIPTQTNIANRYFVVVNYDNGESPPSDEIVLSYREDTLSAYDRDNYIQVYPNPTSRDYITIEFNHPVETGELIITSLSGRKLEQITLNNVKIYNLNVQSLEKGIYLIILSTKGEVYHQKFIKL